MRADRRCRINDRLGVVNSTSAFYGCFPANSPGAPGHVVYCTLNLHPARRAEHPLLLIDLHRARSSVVRLDNVAMSLVEVIGSPGPDRVTGAVTGGERLYGNGGDDTLAAAGGKQDRLLGGPGDDTLVVAPGVKTKLAGGPRSDTLDYSTFTRGVKVDLARLKPAASIENLTGTPFDDTLIGDGNANVLNGGGGNDTLEGGGGNDTLVGGAGDDLMAGGPGADMFAGGAGTDTVTHAGDPFAVDVSLRGAPRRRRWQ